MRKNFGDTVFYYDRFATPEVIVAQIGRIMDEIRDDPAAAAVRAVAARDIFDEKFAGEVMLQNAVRYFEEWRAGAGKSRPPADGPLIDVIVRVGQRPICDLATTVRSIDAQSAGR